MVMVRTAVHRVFGEDPDSPFRKPSIVIVDDDPDTLEAVAFLVQDHTDAGRVDGFSDPREAIRHIRQEPPDLLITDLKMPFISGIELLQRARAEVGPLPCIMMSTMSGRDDPFWRRLPDFRFLEKPLDPRRVLDAVTRFLEPGDAILARQ